MEAVSEVLTLATPSAPVVVNPSAVVAGLTSLETYSEHIIASLPEYSDEELLEVHRVAKRAGKACWQIECMAQAQIVKRIASRQGKQDGLPGRQKELTRMGEELGGLSRRTLQRNAAVADLLSQLRDSAVPKSLVDKNLTDKGFFLEALEAPDPMAALEAFAEMKEENPFFNTGDARRWVTAQNAPPLSAVMPSLIDEPGVQEAWNVWLEGVRLLQEACHGRLNGLLNGYKQELEVELSLPPQTVMSRLNYFFEQQYDEIDEIWKAQGNWERDWVITWFRKMEEEGMLRSFKKQRLEGARGDTRTGYMPTPKFYTELDRLLGRTPLEDAVRMGQAGQKWPGLV